MLAIVNGIGYTIGATIVAGILITILARTITSLDGTPALDNFIRSIQGQK